MVLIGVLAVVGGLGNMASSPQQVAADTFEIPSGAIIDSATFGIYSSGAGGQTVNLHRITAPWTEAGVTWDNFGGHDASVVSSFSANSDGWNTADVTDLVRDWVDGTYANQGLILVAPANNPPYHGTYLLHVLLTLRWKPDHEIELNPSPSFVVCG